MIDMLKSTSPSLVCSTLCLLLGCGANTPSAAGTAGTGGESSTPSAGSSNSTAGKPSTEGGNTSTNGGSDSTPTAGRGGFVPTDKGKPGCGFDAAAFCDTFEAPAPEAQRSRGGELDGALWSGSRTFSQLSTTRALGVGMASILACRPDLPSQVWPNQDALICDPTVDLESKHLLIATASQFYGQNSYRIRQPFDFSGRTGKIVFDASTDPLSPLTGWLSVAITEEPISTPGYSIVDNDEGSIIPKNALEVHFANIGDSSQIGVRNLQVFKDYVDTVFAPPDGTVAAPRSSGKVNHFEISISETEVEVTITPFAEDGVTFAAPAQTYRQALQLPLSQGYVTLSLHNHATLKYTNASDPGGLVNAAIARVDNVGFDGPVFSGWREASVPDSLVKFQGEPFQPVQDPHNPENIGYDIAYVVHDTARGPGPALTLSELDPTGVTSATLAVTLYVDFLSPSGKPADYALRARLNGKTWHERKLTPAEVAFFGEGPTTTDSAGKPLGNPGTQGRLALTLDIPVTDLVQGNNTLEFVTASVPTSYPPLVYNVDLVMRTN